MAARLDRTVEPCLDFESVVAALMSALTSASAGDLDGYVRDGLQGLVRCARVAGSSLARFSAGGGSLAVTHSFGAPPIPDPTGVDLPWYREQLARGHCLVFRRLPDELPAQASAERGVFHAIGARAHLAVPLVSAGRIWGVIGLTDLVHPREWMHEEIRRLRMTGEIIMAAMLRHELEAAARRQRDELVHLARLAALSDLTVALTHELNQPLTAIRANAQATQRLLARGARADLDGVLADIVADATRAADLIQRLDGLLRRRHLERSRVDVNQSINDILLIARMEARRHGANLVVHLAPDLPDVSGDSVQLQQVLLNLVRNAAEAMARVEPDARRVIVETALVKPDQVTVSVIDAGPLVDDATFDRMFSQFYTTKPDGLGMGLAISRSIVEAHGGRLWGERRPEGGLAMRFSLPAATGEGTATDGTKVPGRRLPRRARMTTTLT